MGDGVIVLVELYLAKHTRSVGCGTCGFYVFRFDGLRGCFFFFLFILTDFVYAFLLLAVGLEHLHEDVIRAFVQPCVWAGSVYGDTLLLQRFDYGRNRYVEFFGGLTDFNSRHIVLFGDGEESLKRVLK